MRDVGPPAPVALGDLDRVPEQLLLRLGPQRVDPVDRELALLAPRGVDQVLEAVHRHLAEDGRDRALDRLGEQAQPGLRRRRLLEQAAEDERLAEHARGLGERQRRGEVEDALRPGQRGVDAVAELVGQDEHVAPPRRVVEHHVGRGARHRVGAERAAALAGAHRGVDAAVVEEGARGVRHLRREAGERVEHHRLGVRPRHLELLVGHRGHAVVVRDPVDAEELRLQPVPAARQLVAAADRLDQRGHGLVRGLVGEVAGGQPVRVGAQAVVDHLVGQQRVEHVAADAQAGGERRGDGLRARAAHLAVGGEEPRQRDLERDRLAALRERDLDRRRLLLEQARPRAVGRERLLGEDPLLGLGEQVRPVAARGAQVVPAEVEPVLREQLLGAVVLERRPLELEEQQGRLDLRPALLHELQQRAALGVGGRRREVEHREGARAADQLADRGELPHRVREPGPVERRDPAGVPGGEGVGAPL